MAQKQTKIAIKIGSNVLTQPNGTLDIQRMAALTNQIAELHRQGKEIIVISSGAVASGRSEFKLDKKLDSVEQRQLFSAVGQAKLINQYYELFRTHEIAVGQVLTTKENFATRRHYLNQRNCIQVMLENGVIPIVNENDTISVSELMFTDNDELSGLIASMMDVELLIILTNVDGIFDGDPTNPASKTIAVIRQGEDVSGCIKASKSTFGRGGMLTKTTFAHKIADEGIEVIIANGKRDNVLTDLLADKNIPCTRFIPSSENVSSIKKWIAHSEGFSKGELHINAHAAEVLCGEKAVSLLPVGVEAIVGEFEKDDIVTIVAPGNIPLGVGKTQIDSKKARTLIGKKGQRPIVHYDYLYLD